MNKEDFNIEDPEFKELFNSSIYFVEANSFENLCIYQKMRYNNREDYYKDTLSISKCIGYIDNNEKMSVFVSFRFKKIYDSIICFYEPTSRFVDYIMISDWIKENYNGKPDFTDAMNWHNALHKALEIYNKK